MDSKSLTNITPAIFLQNIAPHSIKSWANLKEFDYVIYRNQSFAQAGELYDGEQCSIFS